SLVQRAQLRVVQPAGDLLAVARDERHRGAAVDQLDRGGHLLRANGQLLGDAGNDAGGGGGVELGGVHLGRLHGGFGKGRILPWSRAGSAGAAQACSASGLHGGIVVKHRFLYASGMKTTLDIRDDLLARAKAQAPKERISLTRMIEEGLALRLR